MVIDEWFKIPEGTSRGVAEYIESRFPGLFWKNLEMSAIFSRWMSRKPLESGGGAIKKAGDVVIHYAPGWTPTALWMAQER